MKTILLTGATDGIGLACAKLLAKENCQLILHGRSEEKLKDTSDMLKKINNEIKLHTIKADFSSINMVKNFTSDIKKLNLKIDVILNNAGIFMTENNLSKEGFDIRFMVNTLAPYIITSDLIPLLNDNSRVISVSSAAQSVPNIQKLTQSNINPQEAYAQSKLAVISIMNYFAEKYEGKYDFISVNPKSFLSTKMVKQAYGTKGYDISYGANILLELALHDEHKGANGKYYDNDNQCYDYPHPFAENAKNNNMLVESLDAIINENI